MTETRPEIEQKNRPKLLRRPKERAKQALIDLLKIDKFPDSPGELPWEFELPAHLVANFDRLINETIQDGRERSQSIYITRKGKFKLGNISTGTSIKEGGKRSRESKLLSAIMRYMKAIPNTELIRFHTHPPRPESDYSVQGGGFMNYPFFHDRDVSGLFLGIAPPISLVGSDRGIWALVKTDKVSNSPQKEINNAYKSRALAKNAHEYFGVYFAPRLDIQGISKTPTDGINFTKRNYSFY